MLCFAVNVPCIAYSMFSSDSNSSTVGLLMNYALFLIYQLTGFIMTLAWFENNLISIERIYKFMSIQPEEKYVNYCN